MQLLKIRTLLKLRQQRARIESEKEVVVVPRVTSFLSILGHELMILVQLNHQPLLMNTKP